MALTPDNLKIPDDTSDGNLPKIWDRLEPMPYEEDFLRSLRAEVHDALWMLTRQWQFGEFKGEDAGSAIYADIEVEVAPISRIAFQQGTTATVLPDQIPMEAVVESETVPISLRDCLRWTVQLKKSILEAGLPISVLDIFLKNFPLAAPTTNNSISQAEKDRWEADIEAQIWMSQFSGKLLDAKNFYTALKAQPQLDANKLMTNPIVPTAQNAKVKTVGLDLNAWWEGLFFQPSQTTLEGASPFWNKKDMDYEFGVSAPKTSGRQVFSSMDYSLGKLDWHAFSEGSGSIGSTTLTDVALLGNEKLLPPQGVINLFPNPTQFPGMPASRFWEFEYGNINLANMKIGNNDLAKVLFAEFALVFSNDWQLVPLTLPFGNVCRVKKITVTDVFGKQSKVINASQNNNIGTDGWSMFGITATSAPEGGLVLPSIAVGLLESPPIEKVYFTKSEWDNVLWAIEKIIPGFLGSGEDADIAFERLKRLLIRKYGATGTPSGGQAPVEEFIYQLLNEIPETQFPYFASGSIWKRQQLKRTITGVTDFSLVEPVSLSVKQDELSNNIPDSGISIERTFQRARGTNGSIVTWLGRKKSLDKPSNWSKMEFDILK